MKPIAKILAVTLILVCLATELYLMRYHKDCLMPLSIISALLTLFVLILAWYLNKTEQLFVTIFNAFKAGLASVLGLLLIIYTALHIGWLGSYITNYVDNGGTPYPALLVLSFFCFPFFVLPFFYCKKKQGETPPEVFISTLSWNTKSDIQMFIDQGFEEVPIATLLGKRQWNWLPAIKVLKKWHSIKKMYLLVSEGAAKEFEGLVTPDGHKDLGIYQYMLLLLGLQRVELHLIKVSNPNNVVKFKEEVATKLANLLDNKEYPDEKLLFDITGGTAIASVALILLAYKGKRQAVYLEQEIGKEPQIFNPDTQSFKELWQQILESL